jgi:hypothetical protein
MSYNVAPSEIAELVAFVAAFFAALFSYLGATAKAPLTIDTTRSRSSRAMLLAGHFSLIAALVGLVHFGATHWDLIVNGFKSWLKV